MTLLIVDDEPKIRELIRKYARFEGYEVDEAVNGMEAVEKCRNGQYDLVIMDVMMPELDGFSACREIRKTSQVPMLMLSARGEEYDRIHGFELGVDDYVVKPFSPKELMMRIGAILKRSRSTPAANNEQVTLGELTVDFTARRVTLHSEALDGDVGLAAGCAAQGKITQDGRIDTKGVHKTRNFHHAVVRQIGDDAIVDDVEVPTIYSAGLDGLNDPAAVLLGTLVLCVDLGRLLQPVGKISLEPVAAFGTYTEIAAGFAIDPNAQVDPTTDFVGTLAVPRYVLGQVTVGLGGEIAKALHHVNANLLCL